MLDNLFRGLFDTDMTTVIPVSDFLLCVASALIIGILLACMYMYKTRYTKSFVTTLALLPAVVCVVILMVNGNVGTGVAVAGTGMLFSQLDFDRKKKSARYKTLHITIPEDLDYEGVFDDLLKKYSAEYELTQVKTTNMGSLFRLTYDLTLRRTGTEKELIDQLRCRNGNLEITLSKQETIVGAL